MNEHIKVAQVNIDGKPYIAFRETILEKANISMQGGFNLLLRRIILTKTDGKTMVGCINFFQDIHIGWGREINEETLYGFGEMLEFSFVNLLPHLPWGSKYIEETFEHSTACISIVLGQESDGFKNDDVTYNIQVGESLFKTAQKIVFKNGLNRNDEKYEILKILLNNLEEDPNTFMKFENLQASIPLTTKELLFCLNFLKEKGQIEFITSPSDSRKIISLRITANGIEKLEGELDVVQYPQVIKQVIGTSIENHTYGPNSPITVRVGQIKNIFDDLQKEIQNAEDLDNKEEILETVKELETELTSNTNPNKVKSLLEKIKTTADWVYDKILLNPYVSGILVDLLMKATVK